MAGVTLLVLWEHWKEKSCVFGKLEETITKPEWPDNCNVFGLSLDYPASFLVLEFF